MAKETRSIMLRIRIEPSFKAKLEQAAGAGRRTLSDRVTGPSRKRAVADETDRPDKPKRKIRPAKPARLLAQDAFEIS